MSKIRRKRQLNEMLDAISLYLKIALLMALFLMGVEIVKADTIRLVGNLRDFQDTHTDFERFEGTNAWLDIANLFLGADGKPTVGINWSGMVSSPDSFAQWYRDVPGVNLRTAFAIELSNGQSNTGGIYSYENLNFFPIDNQLFGNEGRNHNFHFTYELTNRFTYMGGETFTFVGDDDLWVYIDDRLAVDMGGAHTAITNSVSLDTLGLTLGNTYSLNLFFAERHTKKSAFRIDTSIAMESDPGSRINEPFTDGDRSSIGGDQLGAIWYETGGELKVANDGGINSGKALFFSPAVNFGSIRANFNPVVLTNVGDQLQLRFDFRFTRQPANWADSMLVGLYNSHQTRISMDSWSTSKDIDDKGYGCMFNPGLAGNLKAYYERSGDAIMSGGIPPQAMDLFGTVPNCGTNKHALFMQITRLSAGDLYVQAQIDANVMAHSIIPAKDVLTYTFDEIGIGESSAANPFCMDNFMISTGPAGPMIISPFAYVEIPMGGGAMLRPRAEGCLPLSYQWRINGTNIPGETNSQYLISKFELSQVGNYALVASNSKGFVVENVAQVSLADGTRELFRDDFRDSIKSDWKILHPDDSYYFAGSYGLTLRSCAGELSKTSTNYLNLFVIDNPTTNDFRITIRFDSAFLASSNWAQFGLMVYDDDNNYLKSDYLFASRRNLEFASEVAGVLSGHMYTNDFGDSPFYLRTEKTGNIYHQRWSLNGVFYYEMNSSITYGKGVPRSLGFIGMSDPTESSVAFVDYFVVESLVQSSALRPKFDSTTLKHDENGFAGYLTGVNGKTYHLLGSDDLLSWVIVGPVTAGPNPVLFTDPITNKQQRFYRLSE